MTIKDEKIQKYYHKKTQKIIIIALEIRVDIENERKERPQENKNRRQKIIKLIIYTKFLEWKDKSFQIYWTNLVPSIMKKTD